MENECGKKNNPSLLIVLSLYKARLIRPNEEGHVELWNDSTEKWETKYPKIQENGYARIYLLGISVYEHDAMFIAAYGIIPGELDHKNRDKADNHLCNLEEVTHGENLRRRSTYGMRTLSAGDFADLLAAIAAGSLVRDAIWTMAEEYSCCTQTIRNHAKRLGIVW